MADKKVVTYVWVYWDFGGNRPIVEKYELCRVSPRSGVTVWQRGREKHIPKAAGRKFFYDEAEMLAHYRARLERKLEWAKTHVKNLTEDLARPDCNLVVSVTPAERKPDNNFTGLETPTPPGEKWGGA